LLPPSHPNKGTSTFPFSHIRVVPPNEDLPLALGGTVCVSIADACRLRECNRLNVNLKQQKGDVRCPKDVAEFAQYAVRDPSSEFFEGFRCSEVEGPTAGPRDKGGDPVPLVTASFLCAPAGCKGKCGFVMVQKIFACSRSEQMLQVRFKCLELAERCASVSSSCGQ